MLPLRLATEQDIPALDVLIVLSVRELQQADYTLEQRETALGRAFGVDRQLIRDGTYFVVENDDAGQIVGCGGWSWRKKIYGADGHQEGADEVLDPARDPGRIRAFFVHPQWARRGIGRSLLAACEDALRDAGFHRAEMMATLTGEPLYAACGYEVMERLEPVLPGSAVTLPVVHMGKNLG